MRKWGMLLITGVIVSCFASKPVTGVKSKAPYTLTVKTTPCFGRCPFYEMVVSSNGESSFQGFRDPKTDGIIEVKLPIMEIDSLTIMLSDNGFAQMDSIYDNPLITDLPSITLSLEGENGVKTVTGRYNTPIEFRNISAFIERLRKRNFTSPR